MEIMTALCAIISAFCAIMLLRGFSRRKVTKLFWVAMCFVGLAIENSLLFIDLVLLPQIDLSVIRNSIAMAGIICLSFTFFEKAAE